MTMLRAHEQAVWVAALGEHLVRVISPLLPGARDIVSSGSQLLVMVRQADGRPTVATSVSLPGTDGSGELSWMTVAYLLADLQDDIAIHLGSAWPLGRSGEALHARAWDLGDRVGLAFVPRPGGNAEDPITLDPFVPPATGRSRIAG